MVEKEKTEPVYVGKYQFDPNCPALGSGMCGTVFKGFETANSNNLVAIKLIKKSTLEANKTELEFIQREADILKKIRGRNILECKEALNIDGNLYIVTEYCKDGNLERIMLKEGITVEKALVVLKQIAMAFYETESLKLIGSDGNLLTIMHRDIKPANILLREGVAVLADFGYAKFINAANKTAKDDHTKLGTPAYMSPQLLVGEDYSFKCDVWSMGIVTYELIFGTRPWSGENKFLIRSNIRSKALTFPKEIPQEVQDLLKSMLAEKEDDRPDWKEILDHKALASIPLSENKKKTIRIIGVEFNSSYQK